jgi:hypothetical protein
VENKNVKRKLTKLRKCLDDMIDNELLVKFGKSMSVLEPAIREKAKNITEVHVMTLKLQMGSLKSSDKCI